VEKLLNPQTRRCPKGTGVPLVATNPLRIFAACVFTSLALALSSCETAHFYTQAIHGQWQLATDHRPTRDVIADPATPPKLRAQLKKVVAFREFANRELDLPVGRQYTAYKDLKRSDVAWAVYAAPEFSIDAKTWWYPFVGRLKYRGWFSQSEANARALELQKSGYDVFVAGVPAYSTLGWLRDPVLNTFVYLPDTGLAELLFHELAHQRVFISGDTDFNEAFATATAREGVRRWLLAQCGPAWLKKYDAALSREAEFIDLIRQTRAGLDVLYRSTPHHPADILRHEKAARFAAMRRRYEQLKTARWAGANDYDVWFAEPVNNARLNSIATYYDLVPAFTALIQKNHGNLEAYYREVERLGLLPKPLRKAALRQLTP
jgi:predicted aminopeptidase